MTGGGAWDQEGQSSFSLVITSTGPSISANGMIGYAKPRGTLDVTLQPIPGTGGTGTVTVHATF